MKKRKIATAAIVIAILAGVELVRASTFVEDNNGAIMKQLEDKSVTKGKAIKILAVDEKAKILKCDIVELSDKGTLKNKSN